MEVENGPPWRLKSSSRDPFSTSMIMGGRVINLDFQGKTIPSQNSRFAVATISKAMTNALISSCDVDGFRVDTPMLLGEKWKGEKARLGQNFAVTT